MREPCYLIGIDVGGTFTDVLCHDRRAGRMLAAKVPSLPDQQWRGVLDAVAALGIDPGAIVGFVHGTTIATNALLERRGARTALVTTEGFRDTLEIGRTRRLIGGLFDIKFSRPAPLVDRDLRLEVPERTAADGAVLADLEAYDFSEIAAQCRRQDVESVAVGFLNSYVNDQNERVAVDRLSAALADVPVCGSAVMVRERGEFERFSTAVLNAYLTPALNRYLDTLSTALAARGVDAPVSIMGSNGGAMTLGQARRFVAGTFLSGPVGGVGGAVRVCQAIEVDDCITFDMGGTSTDVALVEGLAPRISHANQVGPYPLQVPQLDIHTIGAGGGSVVWRQADGTLEIGPESAGAVPGPAAYQRGGSKPTISDANLLLGRLPTDRPLSGGLELSRPLAEAAFRTLAEGSDDPIRLADGALRIAVAKMAGAVREVSVHRGFDPRAFALVGFGGAGPMHVFLVAEELAIPRVIIPRLPGHLSAYGQLLADHRHDIVRAWGGRLDGLAVDALRRQLDQMRAEGEAALAKDGIAADRRRHAFSLDLRYAGQSFTLDVPWRQDLDDWQPLRDAFAERHEQTFGHAERDNEVEIVNLRLVSIGRIDKPELGEPTAPAHDALLETRPVWFDGDWIDCPIFDREALARSADLAGPAIIEEAGGTTVVPRRWRVRVGATGVLDCRHAGAD